MTISSNLILKNFYEILDTVQEGVFISDINGTTLFINRMYEQITGLEKNIEGLNVRTLVDKGIYNKVLNPEIVQTGKPSTTVQELRNGKKLILSGFPIFDTQGELCLVMTLARDITMLTQMNEQLEEQKKLIEQIEGQVTYLQNDREFDTTFVSPLMQHVQDYLNTVAQSEATVLITGETGVGKDVFSRYTHNMSKRSKAIFLKVDCGSISESLTESEMFGYAPGAFTGASTKGKAGYFEFATGGTVFLDEIGELSLSMQTRLLRILQDGEIMRVGGTKPIKVDVRVIAATNRNLEDCVKQGTFRSDLFYRLNVASIRIPSLRERPEDIRPLSNHFLHQYCIKYHKHLAFMDITLDILSQYPWPGNVRELQNTIHSIVITHKGTLISPQDLPIHINQQKKQVKTYSDDILKGGVPFKEIVAEIEKNLLLQAIEVHGSIQKVSELFQINRSTIFRKLNAKKEDFEDK